MMLSVDQVQCLQNLLISHSTGGHENDSEYQVLRASLLNDRRLASLIPQFVRTCRSLFQFWQFIKHQFPTYKERREFVWNEFEPLVSAIENGSLAPSDEIVSLKLESFDSGSVCVVWQKALDRRQTDPEGAITAARTLIETVCKHVLDELNESYEETADLPRLFSATAKALNLSPSQHTESVFKQILGGCTAVVEGLGTLRNRLSDAHGKGKSRVRPADRHAVLAVNLAGSLATFLVATWENRNNVGN